MTDHRPSAAISVLKQRSAILQTVRAFFLEHGYWEVHTPVMSRESVIDAWLDPFQTAIPGETATRYLQTSPEFAMKRLLGAGADRIFQIGPVFRYGERGERHNPEFTMLEWYGVGDTYHQQMDLVEALIRRVFSEFPSAAMPFPEALERAERLSYDAAFERFTGTRVLHLETHELIALATRCEVSVPESLDSSDRDGWLNLLLAERVEPRLGIDGPTFLYDYPASQSALAVIRPDDPPVAERFELYCRGIELCNGYQELQDPDELARRNREQNAIRIAAGKAALPEHNCLLDAMREGIPVCSGVALGFDRLVMLALGLTHIDQVLAFPWDRA